MKNDQEYLDKIVGIIEKPYFQELGLYGVDDNEEWEYILSRVYGFDTIIFNFDIPIGYGEYVIYDSRGKRVYKENNGYWIKKEYDVNGNNIYYENSDGYLSKWVYDENGNYIGEIIENNL